MKKTVAAMDGVTDAQQRDMEELIRQKGSQVVAHVLYALRDGLDPETFAHCIEILEEK
jgi:hypothetical protein